MAENDDKLKAAKKAAQTFVDHVMHLHGVKSIVFRDGTHGIFDVPGKWVSIIGCMHEGLLAAMLGEELPRFKVKAPAPKAPVKRRCGSRKDGRRCTKGNGHVDQHEDVKANTWPNSRW